MLPEHLRSSYKEYKADSDLVIDWLAKTAQKCGFSAEYLHKDAISTTAAKAKGRKSKKTQYVKVSLHDLSGKTQQQPKWQIPPSDFVKLANFIAEARPKVEVPLYFWSTLQDAIAGRRKHNVYHMQRNSRSTDSNQRHMMFIEILEEVSTILEPLYLETRQEPIKQEPSSPDMNWSSEQEQKLKNDVQTAKDNLEFGTMQDGIVDEEAWFAWGCLVFDCLAPKVYVTDLWRRYHCDQLGLGEVSIVTNTAIQFARTFEAEFVQLFPDWNTSHIAQWSQLELSSIYMSTTGESVCHHHVPQEFFYPGYKAGRSGFFHATQQLLSLHKLLEEHDWRTPFAEWCGYNSSNNRSKMSGAEMYDEDTAIILETIGDLSSLCMTLDEKVFFAEDEITRGVRQLRKTKELSMSLVFAVQIFLDIHHVMRGNICKGFHDMEKYSAHMRLNIEQILEFYNIPSSRQPTSESYLEHVLYGVIESLARWVQKDTVGFLRMLMMCNFKPAEDPPAQPDGIPFSLLKRHPLRCGLFVFAIQLYYQKSATEMVNAQGAVLCAAHVYNALKKEGLLKSTWKDMELALHLHDGRKLFMGGVPSKPAEYGKRFVSAATLQSEAKSKRKSKSSQEQKSTRQRLKGGLSSISAVSQVFQSRLIGQDEQVAFSPQDIEQSLQKFADDYVKAELLRNSDGSLQKFEDFIALLSGHQHDFLTFKAHSVALLDSLLEAVKREKLQLAFDHIRLEISSIRVLRIVQEIVTNSMLDSNKDIPLPMFIHRLFNEIEKAEEASKALNVDKNYIGSYDAVIKVAEGVEKFFESGAGGIGYSMLKDLGFDVNVSDNANSSTELVAIDSQETVRVTDSMLYFGPVGNHGKSCDGEVN